MIFAEQLLFSLKYTGLYCNNNFLLECGHKNTFLTKILGVRLLSNSKEIVKMLGYELAGQMYNVPDRA